MLLLLLVESRRDQIAGGELRWRLGPLPPTLPDQLALLLEVRVQLLGDQLVRLCGRDGVTSDVTSFGRQRLVTVQWGYFERPSHAVCFKTGIYQFFQQLVHFAPNMPLLDSIVVSIPACHAGDRGSIPRRGAFAAWSLPRSRLYRNHYQAG